VSVLLWLLIELLEWLMTWWERAVMLAFFVSIVVAGLAWIFDD
jgi:hypothetical protein